MSYVWAHGKDLDDINNAIKSITGSQTDYTIDEMAAAIDSIISIEKCSFESFLDRSITIMDYDNIAVIENYAFAYCTNLKYVNIPACTSIKGSAFSNCTSLTTVNLPICTSIASTAFEYCRSLTSITLSGSNVCTLGSSAFYNTPIALGNGYIYVPANLVDTYKIAPYWSEYANQIVAIPSE